MKKLLILMDKIGRKSEALAEVIAKEVAEGAKVQIASFSDLVIEINDGQSDVWVDGTDIREFQLVFFRRVGHRFLSLAGTLAMCLKSLKIKYFDTKFQEIGPAGDKFTNLTELSLAKIPVPHSMFLWRDNISRRFPEITEKLGLPVIAKDYELQRNSSIFILRNAGDFERMESLIRNERGGQFLFQEYLDIDKEYRLLVLKDRVAVAHSKAVRNYSGFQVIDETAEDNVVFFPPAEIPEEFKNLAVRAAKELGVEVAGVDICREKTTGKIYILEVNRGPGLFYDTSFSPELGEIAKFFAEELKAS